MDERTDPSAAFALRLSADLLTALVLTKTLSKDLATKLVDDCLNELLASHPEYEPSLRDIAAAINAQTELALIDLSRKLDTNDSQGS